MKRTTPWLCLLAIASWDAGCGDDVNVHFDHDASFGHDAGDAGAQGGGGSSADDDGGADDEDGGATHEPTRDAGTPGSDGGTAQSPAAAFRGQLASATCDALEDCLGNPELVAEVIGGHDCVKRYEDALMASDLRYLSESIEAGLVELHADRIDDCLADVRAFGCDVRSRRLPASCKAAFAGTGLAASECTTNLDCMGDSFCAKGELATCPGVCVSLQAEGQPCFHDDDAQCQDGLACVKRIGTCETLGALGQECGGDLPGCKPGLVCLDQGSGLECVTIETLYAKQLGEDCDLGGPLCVPGLACESVSGTMGKCATRVGRGDSCKRAQPNQCPLTQYCDAEDPGETGTCVDRPGDGQPCGPRAPRCADGYACFDDTCRGLRETDEPCTDDSQCYSGTCLIDSGADQGVCDGALMCPPP